MKKTHRYLVAGRYTVMVDWDDYDYLSGYRWCVTKFHPYPGTSIGKVGVNRTRKPLHWFLMAPPTGLVVDHISGDKMDNRRCNLRLATRAQNQQNMFGQRTKKTSKYKGVFPAPNGRWKVHICNKYVGTFDTQEDAARAYNETATRRFGEFAKLNVLT